MAVPADYCHVSYDGVHRPSVFILSISTCKQFEFRLDVRRQFDTHA